MGSVELPRAPAAASTRQIGSTPKSRGGRRCRRSAWLCAVEAGGRPYARKQLGFGTPEDAAGLVAFLASDAAADISGQAIGIGGDRLALWSHPAEVVVELADGTGWSADAIAAIWPQRFAPSQQPVGPQFPEPPA